METSNLRCDAVESNEVTRQDSNATVLHISQLPTELLAEMIRLALPSVDIMLPHMDVCVFVHVRGLYTMRLIAKQWQEIIDGTPTFWTYVLSTLPPHVNKATISRSGTCPLTIISAAMTSDNVDNHPSTDNFLGSLAHTYPRWSAYIGPVVSGYLDKPAAHLQTIILGEGHGTEAFELLGGSTTGLRHVDIRKAPIQWKAGLFTQLKVLKLEKVFSDGLTTTHLLEILRASPCLEHLELSLMHAAAIDHPPSSPVITFPHLRHIYFYLCRGDFIGAILRHIQAPACLQFNLTISLRYGEPKLPRFLNEDLWTFKELLRAIHNRYGSSEIILDSGHFEWNSPAPGARDHPAFSVFIFCRLPVPCIQWVENILQSDRGLSICFNCHTNMPREVYEILAPMQCVTRVEIDNTLIRQEVLIALGFAGEPQSANPSLPSLPCLRELVLGGRNWTAQNLLDMVRSRFNSRLWEGTGRTPLTISLPRRAFGPRIYPQAFVDLTTLAEIRGTDGIECVQFVGPEDLDGRLAITWNEETSAPAWGLRR
ncbi:hypothetical protein M407DRAFT_34385 [Tulasnella calospora MUT 4182]|uniref:F-box domain-containing protein n=1 Tax=Tulasnella calospora MUT 4182 TaxID=1051891 RepID=A0A0C3Q0T3_9AGAM|nr:hypothetical protein M407DRAFT_34764 [Tulasnella calospora MUT 4182]KIO15984.1 hypothetical protein M407DRAFT_34385 [Tulasnella calospora MUT 4182]